MASQRRVHEPYIFAALCFALTAGFGLAAIIVAALALKAPLGAWWIALVQAHGHAQLFGWAGLFVIGVSLFFLPRLRGTTLARAQLAPWALASFCIGITLRVVSQPLLALLESQMPQASPWEVANCHLNARMPVTTLAPHASAGVGDVGRSGLALSGIFELIGACLVVTMLVSSFRRARPPSPDAPVVPVRPYLATAFVSFIAAILLNAALSLSTALRGNYLFPSDLNDVLIDLLIAGFILPLALALSIRNLPLFMRLAFPPQRELLPILISYVIGLVLHLAFVVEQGFYIAADILARLGGLGRILEGGALLVFIWQFDILLRRKRPWTESKLPTPPAVAAARRKSSRGGKPSVSEFDDARDDLRKPTRKNYPDYGEFGRFELLVISAYLWLAFASAVLVIDGAAMLVSASALFNQDMERHAITVGFITLLIFGMAVRMLPGFSGKTRVASTRLVLATFWLGNLAALTRVLPLLAPNLVGANLALASSGALGWLAVACLAVNLGKTWLR